VTICIASLPASAEDIPPIQDRALRGLSLNAELNLPILISGEDFDAAVFVSGDHRVAGEAAAEGLPAIPLPVGLLRVVGHSALPTFH